MMRIIKDAYIGHEHEQILLDNEPEYEGFVGMPEGYMGVPKYLGIDSIPSQEECTRKYVASYFIGASLLPGGEKGVCILPKIRDLDYAKLWNIALNVDTPKEYFSKCYGFYSDQDVEIESDVLESILTPLIIIHYLKVIKSVLARGLKKDYIIREENLKYKVKGRYVMSSHLKKNVFVDRMDRNYCSFLEYTVNTPINQLLKSALMAAKCILGSYKGDKFGDAISLINKYLSGFSGVEDTQDVRRVSNKGNKLFKDYSEAIKLAHMILRKTDYAIGREEIAEQKKTVEPFWIDMTRLFEMYVLHKLKKTYPLAEIKFQVNGYTGVCDYTFFLKKNDVERRIIIDAKYKPWYNHESISQYEKRSLVDDIREVSGYARDEIIRKELKLDEYSDEIVDCLIINPNDENSENDLPDNIDDLLKTRIEKVNHFYKFSINMPLIQK